MGWVLLVASCAFVVLTAAAVALATRPTSGLDLVISMATFASAEIVVVTLLAGSTGNLGTGTVVGLTAALAVPAIGVALTRPIPQVPFSLPSLPDIGLALRRHWWVGVLVLLAAGALLWQVVVALVLPPYSFDANTYHLTIAASWIQQGDLAPPDLSPCCARYPANAELLFSWPMVILGRDTVVGLVQVAFAVLGSLSVVGIARSAGLGRAAAVAAGCLFATTPIVLVQAPTQYADVIVTGWALAALHSLMQFSVTGRPRRLIVAGVAAGLLLGTKGTGIVWAAVIVAAMAGLVVVCRRRGGIGSRQALMAVAGIGACCLVFGGFWFVRNTVDTGNPFSPFNVEVAGVTVFDGPLELDEVATPSPNPTDGRAVAVIRAWAEDVDFWNVRSVTYEQRAGGLGPLWPWLGLPLLVLASVRFARDRNPVLLAFGIVAVVLVFQPYQWWSRFTMQLPAIGAISIAWFASRVRVAALRTGLQVAAVGLAVIGTLLAVRLVDPAGGGKVVSAGEVAGLLGDPTSERTLGEVFFSEYRFVDSIPPGAQVIVDLEAEPVRFNYPLFGRSLERTVEKLTADPPAGAAWVVTATDRPVDRDLAAGQSHQLVWDERDVRVWAPRPGG